MGQTSSYASLLHLWLGVECVIAPVPKTVVTSMRRANPFRENCQTRCLISQLLGYNFRNPYCKGRRKCLKMLTCYVQLLLDCPVVQFIGSILENPAFANCLAM
jgi:hypothetical protein